MLRLHYDISILHKEKITTLVQVTQALLSLLWSYFCIKYVLTARRPRVTWSWGGCIQNVYRGLSHADNKGKTDGHFTYTLRSLSTHYQNGRRIGKQRMMPYKPYSLVGIAFSIKVACASGFKYIRAEPSEKGAYGFSDVKRANDVNDVIYDVTVGKVKHGFQMV